MQPGGKFKSASGSWPVARDAWLFPELSQYHAMGKGRQTDMHRQISANHEGLKGAKARTDDALAMEARLRRGLAAQAGRGFDRYEAHDPNAFGAVFAAVGGIDCAPHT
jgi:hypothetical protein